MQTQSRPSGGVRVQRAFKSVGSFLLVILLTYLGLLAVTFFIGRVIPIDPVLAIVGDRAPEHVIARVREELGLNKPLWEQFYIYLSKVLQGDFGTSVLTSNPVMQDIRRTFPATIELATLGIIIGAGIGVPLGVWAAVRRGGLVDQVVRVMGLIGYSVPIFWLGLMGLVLFYARLGWVSGPGRIDVTYEYTLTTVTGFLLLDAARAGQWDAFGNVLSHLILPASLLGYFSLAYISRMTRSFMLNELAQEYVIAARAKGLSETRIIWRHALRNAMVPLVTVVALSYAGLLEGSVLTETVFAWPGLGLYITNSLQNADMNAVLGGTIIVGSVFIGLNLLSDLLYRLLDPRTKQR
ncbi:MAG: ABC transporter permease [Rhodoferax sp.]|nr:ABC transporter permease [Rhodoferax sp.]MBP6493229.1 ABC transporter permease [Rhodoferax sp.]